MRLIDGGGGDAYIFTSGPFPCAVQIPFYSKIPLQSKMPRSAHGTGPAVKIYASPPPPSIKRISYEYINSTPC